MTWSNDSPEMQQLRRVIQILSLAILALGILYRIKKGGTAPPDVPEPTGRLDRLFANSNLVLLLLGPWFLCPLLPVAVALAGYTAFTSKHPVARERAWMVLGVDLLIILGTVYLWITMVLPAK